MKKRQNELSMRLITLTSPNRIQYSIQNECKLSEIIASEGAVFLHACDLESGQLDLYQSMQVCSIYYHIKFNPNRFMYVIMYEKGKVLFSCL